MVISWQIDTLEVLLIVIIENGIIIKKSETQMSFGFFTFINRLYLGIF